MSVPRQGLRGLCEERWELPWAEGSTGSSTGNIPALSPQENRVKRREKGVKRGENRVKRGERGVKRGENGVKKGENTMWQQGMRRK